MCTADDSADGVPRTGGLLAGRARLGDGVRRHGDRPEPRLESDGRTDFGPTLPAADGRTAAAFEAGRLHADPAAGPARGRVWTRWRRASL